MKQQIMVRTPKGEWPLDDIENYMDLHGIHKMDEAIRKLNRENRRRRNPIRFFIRISKSIVPIIGWIILNR